MRVDTDARPFADTLPSWLLLTLGSMMLLLTGPRWNLPALAFVAPVPFLLFARRARSIRAWLALFGVLLFALTLQVAKITTEPLHPAFSLMFSVPASVGMVLVVLASELLRRRVGATHGVLAFAAYLRAVRWAPSAGLDALGRVRGFMPTGEGGDGVLVTTLPLERIETWYGAIGDAPFGLLIAYLFVVSALSLGALWPSSWGSLSATES